MKASFWLSLLVLYSASSTLAYAQACPKDQWVLPQAQPPGPRLVWPPEVRGTGCPRLESLCPQAQLFESGVLHLDLHFANYLLTLRSGESERSMDCVVTFAFESPTPVSYALLGYQFDGWAQLERGEEATISTSMNMLDAPGVRPVQTVASLPGPWPPNPGGNSSWLLQEQTSESAWSQCSTRRTFELHTSLSLRARTFGSLVAFTKAFHEFNSKDAKSVVAVQARPCGPQ